MFELILRGVGLGFAAGSTPGALMSFLIATTLAYGWRSGILVIFAPFLTDLPIIILTTFLLTQLSDVLLNGVQLLGGFFVLYIAWGSWQQYRAGVTFQAEVDVGGRVWKTLGKAATMNLLSPGPYIFWTTVNGPLLRQGLDQSLLHGVAFLVAFYGTFMGFMALMVLGFDRLRTLDQRVTSGILLFAIVVLVLLGVSLIGSAVNGLFSA